MDGIWHYSWDSFLELQISDFHMEMCSPPTNRGQIKGNSINWSVLSVQYVKSEIFDRQPTSLKYVIYPSVNAKNEKGLLITWLIMCTWHGAYSFTWSTCTITLTFEFRLVICLMLLDMNSSWCSFCLPKAIAPLVMTRGWVPERWSSAV